MRKPILFFTGLTFAALAFGQIGTSTLLTSFGKAINDAKAVTSNYTFQTISKGGKEDYSITLKKPNMVRIETPKQILVADGKELTTYDKAENTFLQADRKRRAS